MGKHVTMITGGSRGIGYAIAMHLISKGHDVINLSRAEPQGEFPGIHYSVDLMNEEETSRVLKEVVSNHKVDNVVNNAGIDFGTVDSFSLEGFDEMVGLNLRAVIQCTAAVVPNMIQNGYGRIVNIGSRAALGRKGRAIYSMTKSGLIGLSRSLALELAGSGITVNVISPGPIDTALARETSDFESPEIKSFLDSIPVGRIGMPDDIAPLAAFLLQQEAGYITGQNIYVCGGLSV